mgnify:CR=1 FL=1
MDEAFDDLLPVARPYSSARLMGIVGALLRLLRRWRVRARRRNELAGLSLYLLEDIGISAAEAQRESERMPWQAPLLKPTTPTPRIENAAHQRRRP